MKDLEEFKQKKLKELIRMEDISRKGFYVYKREAMTCMFQHNMEEKFHIIERLRLEKLPDYLTNKNDKVGQLEYRIGYYIVGKIGKAKDRWWWGQFCPMIPKEDFDKLFDLAKKEKTII